METHRTLNVVPSRNYTIKSGSKQQNYYLLSTFVVAELVPRPVYTFLSVPKVTTQITSSAPNIALRRDDSLARNLSFKMFIHAHMPDINNLI